uniref:Reverse transcriptase domain-containing protein n=1 Tax=Knipowitschia caucasica TaxID=637954 RepID=A0AAV2IV26_KNICA
MDSLESSRLPLSCRRAVLTLLPKKGNLQVSLLCMDYKILSKVRGVMASVIHVDQTYCVPSRLIGDNHTLIRDVLEVSGSLGINLGLISMDQEKAFDRVEHQFLWQTMTAFGFSPGFIAHIRTVYCDIMSVLKALNHQRLCDRADTVWRSHLGTAFSPAWGALYKPPLTKKQGDLQWRLLHGAIAVNAFVCRVNRAVGEGCPFCGERETVFHCFWEYSSRSRRRGRLLSFLVGQAKMAVYVSRRRMVQDQGEISPRALLVRMVQARLRLEFGLYRINGDQEGFEERWGFRECDESVDASDTAQLALFVRMVFEDFSTKEEFLTLLPLKTSTRGIDIYNVVKGYVVDKKFPIRKLVSITSDGAPAMTGRHNGFIAHCKADPDFPKFLNYHYNQLHSTKGKATSELQIVPGGMRRGSRGSSPSYGHQVVKSRRETRPEERDLPRGERPAQRRERHAQRSERPAQRRERHAQRRGSPAKRRKRHTQRRERHAQRRGRPAQRRE